MKQIINGIRGTVRLELTGAFPERFLNLCAVENLPFWDAEQTDAHTLRVTLALPDRRRAEGLAERGMCRTREVARKGLPAFLSRFRRRHALLAGLALSLAALCVLSNFILVVDITGGSQASRRALRTELRRLGFGVGSYAPAVNERELVNRAMLDLEDIGFLTINIKGIRAEVVVRDAPKKPEIIDPNRPADVVARRDGLILSVGARAGEKQVQPGDAVLKGEVLISGLVTSKRDETGEVFSSRQVRAAGEVWALTERTLREAIPLDAAGKGTRTGTQTRYALRLLDRRINFYGNGSISGDTYDKISREYKLTLPGGRTLPAAWIKTTVTGYAPDRVRLTRKSAQAYLKQRLAGRLKAQLADGTALSRSWKTTERDGVLTVTLRAECREQIGRTLELAEKE